MGIRIRILEKVEMSSEVRERLEEGIHFLYSTALWGVDSHPSLWTALKRARELLEIEESQESQEKE